MDLDVRHLRLVVTIADAGSLSAAARDLGMQQPTVSTQLKRIEDLLGGPLFERSAQGVEPTERGRTVLRRARAILARMDQLDTPEPESAERRTVRVRTYILPFEVLLPLLTQLAPTVQWEIFPAGPEEGMRDVAEGRADLFYGLRLEEKPAAAEGLVMTEILREKAWALLPADHRLASRPTIKLRDLADETWVSRPEPELHQALVQECRQAGFEPNVQFRAIDNAALMKVVGSGGGVTVTSPAVERSGAVVLRPCEDAVPHAWVIGHRPGAVPTGLVRMIRDLMRWAYAFRARSDPELLATLPEDLASAPFPEPFGPPATPS
ncbi:MAG TPA: LysR family transcriptional regulator [Pseudonocardia sp.]|nr:LysR family transcriptional regulator [Pseudonocardia sp.]